MKEVNGHFGFLFNNRDTIEVNKIIYINYLKIKNRLAFYESFFMILSEIDLIFDLLFLIDFIMQFFLGYISASGILVTKHSEIIYHYLQSYFILKKIYYFL